jgi:CheY-like chemotaxis protein
MDIATILDAAAKLLWPILAGVLAWKLFPSIRRIIESRGFTFKVGGIEVTVQQAANELAAQVEDLKDKVAELRQQVEAGVAPGARSPLARPPRARTPGSGPVRRLLWVDDEPANNAYQIASFRKEGLDVDQADSTPQAVRMLRRNGSGADVVISDMGRQESGRFEPLAGLKLIEAVRAAGIDIPIIIYTSVESAARYRDDVLAAGGSGITASPVELDEMIRAFGPQPEPSTS